MIGRKILTAGAIATFLLAIRPAVADPASGVFVAVGGGAERPEILATLLRLIGGRDRRVVVLPMASSDPATSGRAYKSYFQAAGVRDVMSLLVDNRDAANELEPVKDIGRADMLYFSGGDQSRLVNLLANTAVHGSIQTAWQRQVLLAGTSAGAMIWGPEYIANGTSEGALKLGFSRDSQGNPGLELRPGLNLWDNLIIDTHFTEKQRLGRLLLAVTSSPGTTGLGVDQGTAAVVTADTVQAVGAGSVTVLETDRMTLNNSQAVGPGTPLAVGRVTMHRLLPGKVYLRRWKTIQEDHPLPPADSQPPTAPFLVAAGTDVPRKDLGPIADFVRACGGNQARILLLSGENATQGANLWKTHLLKLGAAQVVNYQSIELSDQGMAIALQQATGVFMLEDSQANLLHALLANQGRLAQVILDASKRLPMGAAGNAVRLLGVRAVFGTPGDSDYQSLPGLKLLPSVVLDKQFWRPESFERLLRGQLQTGRTLAVGLSPDNAVTISGGQMTVAGSSQAIFLEGNEVTGFQLPANNSAQPSGVSGLALSVIPPTGSYDLIRHQPRS